MIEDGELRELFKAESEEHLQKIDADLLGLEKEPAGRKLMEELHREAHSLKGAARMLGVRNVEELAHKMESLIAAPLKAGTPFTAALFDALSSAAAALGKLVLEAVTGQRAGVDIPALEQKLEAAQKAAGGPAGGGGGRQGAPPPVAPEGSGERHPAAGGEPEAAHEPEPASSLALNTVRVEAKRLDGLMTHAGELSVLKVRIRRRLAESEEAADMLEKLVATDGPNNREGRMEKLLERVSTLKAELREDSSRMEYIAGALDGGIREARLVPFSALFNLFPRMVRDLARDRSKVVELEIAGGDAKADKRIIEEMKDPLMHLIRNSIDHGLETPEERERAGKPRAGKIRLSAFRTEANIVVEVADDGRGLDVEAIKKTAVKRKMLSEKELEATPPREIENLVFAHGFSTSAFVTDVSGRGIGLDVVRANVEALKGSVQAESKPGVSCVFRVKLPVTLTTARVLLVEAGGGAYAIPMEYVDAALRVAPGDVFHLEGKPAIAPEHRGAVWVAELSDVLGLPKDGEGARPPAAWRPCVILAVGEDKFGVFVDDLLDEQEVVLKVKSGVLKRVRNVSDATILADGEICSVLNPNDMLRTIRKQSATAGPPVGKKPEERKRSVLLVEDSITTRTQEKRILEGGGYEVVTAVNGVDALEKLSRRSFDAVVSDVIMPEMDGLALTTRIRGDKRNKDLPVILVTTLASDEDKKRGLEAGANAYIPKPSFDQKILLETLERLA